MKTLRKLFRDYLYLLPIVNFLITVIVYFIPMFISDWIFIGNLGGYSIITSLVYVGVFCFSKIYCSFTKITSVGLLLIATFNTITSKLVTNSVQYQLYESSFSKIIVILSIILSISLYLIKCKHQYFQQKQ